MKKKIIEFTKMHGTGNDYIYVNNIKFPIENAEQKAIEWSKPHFGIGSDGLILIDKSEIADFKMRIFNADGSEAMMCGNGSRCVARYLYEYQLTDKTEITLETLSGIKHLKLNIKKNKVESVTVNMGKPLEIKTIQVLDKKDLNSTFVSMGNPHVVTFVNNINTVVLDKIGPKIEHHNLFPDRTNVEFAEIIDCNKIRMRVWERGSGITMACGTGACATAIAAISQNKTSGSNEIVMDGGSVFIEWNETTKEVLMTGPAEIVFKGEIESS